MSNFSGASSSATRGRGRVVGVHKRCWCGEQIIAKISRSESNSYRWYYRCSYAATHKLVDDNHTFKWVEEAMLNEIDALSQRISKLEVEKEQEEEEVTDRLKMCPLKIEFETKISEAEDKMKRLMIFVLIACVVIIGLSKYVG